MTKIEFNNYDFQIKLLADGKEVVQIRPALAFNETFIKEMKELGVSRWISHDEINQINEELVDKLGDGEKIPQL